MRSPLARCLQESFVGARQLSVVVFVAAFTAGLLAEQGGVIRREEPASPERETQRFNVNFAAPWRPAGTNAATRVVGTVLDIRQAPVPNATVQLRNLDTGNVEQTTESDGEGEYDFAIEDPATYVVEMVMADGYIVALSNAGSLARYETLNTVVQLPGRWDFASRSLVRSENVVNFFGMSASTTMTATTIAIAVDASIPPANPGTPVSPVTPVTAQ
jgi:hypothetical protein